MLNTFRIFKFSIKKNTETYTKIQKKNLQEQEIYHLQYNKEVEHEEWSHLFNNLLIHIDTKKIIIEQFNTTILILNILDDVSIRISKMGKIMAIRWNLSEKIQIKFYTEQESNYFHEKINETVVNNLKNGNNEKKKKLKEILQEMKELNSEESAHSGGEKGYDEIKRKFIALVNKKL